MQEASIYSNERVYFKDHSLYSQKGRPFENIAPRGGAHLGIIQ